MLEYSSVDIATGSVANGLKSGLKLHASHCSSLDPESWRERHFKARDHGFKTDTRIDLEPSFTEFVLEPEFTGCCWCWGLWQSHCIVFSHVTVSLHEVLLGFGGRVV